MPIQDQTMKDAGPQPALLDGVRRSWYDIEENWLDTIAQARLEEDQRAQQEYEREATILYEELAEAMNQNNRLTEALLQARVLVDAKKSDVDWLEEQFRRRKTALAQRRREDDICVRAWFTKVKAKETQRQLSPETGHQKESHDVSHAIWRMGRKVTDIGHDDLDKTLLTRPLEASALPELGGHQMSLSEGGEDVTPLLSFSVAGRVTPSFVSKGSFEVSPEVPDVPLHVGGLKMARGVQVVDPDGTVVGLVKPIDPVNHWIQKLLEIPLLRRVDIRSGRKFTVSHLEAIYERNDQKRTKWLSAMIQATGQVQERACQTCAKGQGLYSLCIIVGGSDFPRCGNCEWNKQGCHGASHLTAAITDRDAVAPRNPSLLQLQAATSHKPVTRQGDERVMGSLLKGKEKASHASANTRTKDFQRQSRYVEDWPMTPLRSGISELLQNSPISVPDEIKPESLALKDDGMVFIEPELMCGVPVRKITQDHAYWDADWKPVEASIRAKLDEWIAKLAMLRDIPESTQTEKDRTAIFQANRQVNRGKATMKFLPVCEFHPYQLVGKQWISPALIHYDTLFRLVASLEELAKFKINVTPLQWLRQRLHEIYSENPVEFKLDRVIAKMYHDPKLSDLRSKNGFGNIGRPSTGARTKSLGDSGSKTNSSSVRTTTGEKRKESGGGGGDGESGTSAPSPSKRVLVEMGKRASNDMNRQQKSSRQLKQQQHGRHRSPVVALGVSQSSHRSKTSGAQRKLPLLKHSDSNLTLSGSKAGSSSGSRVPDDLEYSGYTSTDSLTHDPVVKKDWRVYQVKTSNLTSNPHTTQYWHWVDERHANKAAGPGGPNDFEPMFEHQVLKETDPTTSWGVFKEPIDFHLRLRELGTIAYSQSSQKIVISTRQVPGVEPRGNVLAHFKRERTKRRFLAFMHKKEITLVRKTSEAIEEEWNRMQSDVMPGGDSD